AIWGGFAATIGGTLANDSGTVMFEAGLLMLLLATGYARSRPDPAAEDASRAPLTATEIRGARREIVH
ncbi:MAG: hypothetical protein JOZ25_06695, partial [Actinobacteria bacterium]|nr:hypothetical protein [Actinomycetota bacterium]